MSKKNNNPNPKQQTIIDPGKYKGSSVPRSATPPPPPPKINPPKKKD